MTRAPIAVLAVLAAAGCRAPTAPRTPAAIQCRADETHVNGRCRRFDPAIGTHLAAAKDALGALEPETALTALDRVRAAGPRRLEDQARYFELTGIAQAFLGNRDDAVRAFTASLAVAPDTAIAYTLPAQITFMFEEARRAARTARTPVVHLNWPAKLRTDRAIAFDVSVLDAGDRVPWARLHVGGPAGMTHYDVDMSRGAQRITIPPPAPTARADTVLRAYVVAYDADGSEIARWGNPQRPHELPLAYVPPPRWYRRWWVWAAIGGGVAAVTGVTVYLVKRGPPDEIPVEFFTAVAAP